MAILKDSLVQGSMRVTDTLYTNLLSSNNLNTKLLEITSDTANSINEGINFINSSSTIIAHIGTSTNFGIYSAGTIMLRPGGSQNNSSEGIVLSTTSLLPKNASIALGGVDNRWNGIYSSTGDFTGTVTISKSQDASGTANNSPALIVGGTATSAHLELDDNEIMAKATGTTVGPLYLNNDGGTVQVGKGGFIAGNATAGVEVDVKVISNAGQIYLYSGATDIDNRGIYGYNAKGAGNPILTVNQDSMITGGGTIKWYYTLSSTNRYIGHYLKSKNNILVGDTWYDVGDNDTIASGIWNWRAYSPNNPNTTTTTGKYITYYLPPVDTGLSASKTARILTTKNDLDLSGLGQFTLSNGMNIDTDCIAPGTYNSSSSSVSGTLTGTVFSTNAGFKLHTIVGYRAKTLRQFGGAADQRLYYRSSQDTGATWTKWYQLVKLPSGDNNKTFADIGNATQPVYVNADGLIIACTAIKALAYKDSLVAADIPTISITDKTSGTLTVARGGTGATTAPLARASLGTPPYIQGVFYGTCGTAQATKAKQVILTNGEGFSLTTGAVVFVKFTNASAASTMTMAISADGGTTYCTAKSLYRYATTAMSSGTTTTGWRAGAMVCFVYDGTGWERIFWENSTYSYMRPYESTADGTTSEKTGSAGWKFQLTAGKYFMYSHYYDNTYQGALTLNIGSTGAKPIYINGSPSSSTNYALPGGQYLVYYDGTNYYFRTDDKMTGNITGTAMGLYRLDDTRETTTQPNNYNDKILFTALKRNTVIGITSNNPFSYVVGLRGWGDSSGGDAHELAFNNDGIFWRHGATTTWGSWAKLLDTTGGTLTGNLTLDTTHAVYGILGTFNTTTSTDCGGLSWHEVSAVGPSTTLNVNDAPNTDWWYVLRNRHTNTTNNYYTDIAIPFNCNGIYYKVIRNNTIVNTGTYNGWVKVLDEFGGVFNTTSALEKYGNNTSWVNARDGAIIRRYRNFQGETTASLVSSGNYDIANGRYVAAVSLIGLYYTWSIAQYTNDTLYFDCTNNDHYNSATNQTVASISMTTSGALTANQVYGAVWNDYAEYRKQLYKVEPGRVVYDLDDGYILPTDKRLQPGAQVVSDTFGFAIGETEESKTPLAVTGRVLVYTYRDRYEYHAGDAVCSAPNGTVDIMTREEIKEYPDAIIGIVSEIPHYETWGTSNVPVNGRIWIKVR